MSKEESKNKKVIIKWKAYVKMMKHVLRFGSNSKDKSQFKEVMGILIGRLDDKPGIIKDVIIEDAVPISHGGHIEVAFKPEDYGSFSIVDSDYADRSWFSVGWYHSHPGLTCFFSAVDVRNQMGWQGPNNSAVGIVWDHTRLGNDDGDMGFEIYRLDDPQNPMSDYHKLNWIVEPPEDVDFYGEALVDLINNIQKGEPPILELNEVPDVFGDFEIPGQSAMMSKEPELIYGEISETLKGGIEKMSDIFIKPLLEYLNEWARGITQGLITKNVIMLQNLKGLKENLSKSMADLQSWFKFALNDNLRNLWVDIDDRFDADVETRNRLSKKLEELSNSLDKTLSKAFDEALAQVVNEITSQVSVAVEKLKEAGESSKELTVTIDAQKELMQSANQNYNDKIGQLKQKSDNVIQDSVKALKNGLEPVAVNIDEIQKQLSEIKLSLKAINGMIKGGN